MESPVDDAKRVTARLELLNKECSKNDGPLLELLKTLVPKSFMESEMTQHEPQKWLVRMVRLRQ